jgi:hypothetical protein
VFQPSKTSEAKTIAHQAFQPFKLKHLPEMPIEPKKLLDDAHVWCIVSLPAGVFTSAGAGVKTNILFFTKGKSTESIWY